MLPSPLLALMLLCVLTLGAYRRQGPAWLSAVRHGLAAVTLWTWACCTPAVTNALMTWLEGPVHAEPGATAKRDANTTVIVLASGELWAAGGRPAPRLDEHGWERLHAGVGLWRRTGGTLIFTGGPGGVDSPTLAGLMGGVAQELGVPADAVKLAVNSNTTYQDLKAARPLIPEQGPVWLVTSAAHMPRAMGVARRFGIDARPHPVDYRQILKPTWRTWLPDNGAPERMAVVAHEMVGWLYYRWKGWIA